MSDSPASPAITVLPIPLDPDEVVLAIFKPAARSIFLDAAPWIGICICVAVLASKWPATLSPRDLTLLAMGASVAILCLHLMCWIPRFYVVTSRRVLVAGGILHPVIVAELPLRRIERVFLHRHLNQQFMGLANVWMDSDRARLCCDDLADAKAMLDAVSDAVHRFGGRT